MLPDPASKVIDYKPGESVTVEYQDRPTAAYLNYYDDKEAKGELSSVKVTIKLALWLAARRQADDAQELRAYSMLWGQQITYTSKLTVTKTLSQLRAEAKAKGMNFYKTLGSPEYEFESKLDYKQSAKGIVPILVDQARTGTSVSYVQRLYLRQFPLGEGAGVEVAHKYCLPHLDGSLPGLEAVVVPLGYDFAVAEFQEHGGVTAHLAARV